MTATLAEHTAGLCTCGSDPAPCLALYGTRECGRPVTHEVLYACPTHRHDGKLCTPCTHGLETGNLVGRCGHGHPAVVVAVMPL